MVLRKILTCSLVILAFQSVAQNRTASPSALAKEEKKNARKEKINQLIKQEEEGALVFNKQSTYAIKLNTDGWGFQWEKGKYKTLTKTNLWWIELGERRNKKEERIPTISSSQGFILVSNYTYGKSQNFYYTKLGLGQQRLIGGKGNKNGVAVSAIYGGGLSVALLKPYYLEIQNPTTGLREQIKYTGDNENVFLDPTLILGRGGMFKGFGEMKFVPGAHVKTALRFDYGRFNELVSALEVGLNAEFYSQKISTVLLNPERQFFFNAYAAITFGRRK